MTYSNETQMDDEIYGIFKQMMELQDKARRTGLNKTYDAIDEALTKMQIAISVAYGETRGL